MQHEESKWGLISPDGYFQPISSLTSATLEYASKSLDQLQVLLLENIEIEAYEKCAVIRDEINKRKGSLN